MKFNDYFEFPKEFDMAPYTAARLAKNEGTYLLVMCCMYVLASYLVLLPKLRVKIQRKVKYQMVP